ncbi:unnamed protein product [Trichobilharzia regenti]|nr:unnamed protein product [Trichobilharzia regenti]
MFLALSINANRYRSAYNVTSLIHFILFSLQDEEKNIDNIELLEVEDSTQKVICTNHDSTNTKTDGIQINAGA